MLCSITEPVINFCILVQWVVWFQPLQNCKVPLLVECIGACSYFCSTASSLASLEPSLFETEALVKGYTQVSDQWVDWQLVHEWHAACHKEVQPSPWKGFKREIRHTSSGFRSHNSTKMLSRFKLLALAWAGSTPRFKALWQVLQIHCLSCPLTDSGMANSLGALLYV